MSTIYLGHDQQEDPSVRKAVLEKAGHVVKLFSNSVELLAAIEKAAPQVLLLDVLIEGQNGYEVCRKLRESVSPQKLPVVLGSVIYRSRVYRDEAWAAGAQRFVPQPTSAEDLLRCVNELLLEATATARG